MKQIIAIIRDERVEKTKEALAAIDIQGVTFLHVTGRGEQKGRVSAHERAGILTRNLRMQLASVSPGEELQNPGTRGVASPPHPDSETAFGFLPKRMIILVTLDKEVNRIVQAIVNVNQTGRHGDGRIFICPMISAIRVRTGEQGDLAIS
jgi:nitrogen regulatory protein PII 2